MNTLILIVILVGAAIGFYQGAFKQIAKFVGVFVGVILASKLSEPFGDYLADKAGTSSGLGQMVAFVLIVIVVPVLLGWVASLLTSLFASIHLGFVNRLCGAAVGVLSYMLVLSFAFNMFDFSKSKGGYATDRLEEREPLFYTVKHVSQPFIPDVFIVTDDTEIADGEEPKYGIKTTIDKTIDKINPFSNE